MYCGMALLRQRGKYEAIDVIVGTVDSLHVWSKDVTDELNKKGDLRKLQLDAVAYLGS